MTLVLVLAAGIAFAIWRIQRATPPARRVPVTPTGGATGQDQHCRNAGHYYRKAFADMWRCVNCGHLQPVSNDEVLDSAAETLRAELPLIESYANGEAL